MKIELTVEAVVASLGLLALFVSGFAVRRRALQRGGGTFDCSLREALSSHSRGWTLGIARYGEDNIQWFRAFSLSLRPKRTWERAELAVRLRRSPSGAEALAVPPGAVIVQCVLGTRVLELAMAQDALTGLLAWLEASPPGRNISVS